MSQSPASPRWHMALLLVAGLVAFAGGIGGQFVFDDFTSLVDDPQMHQLWPWGPIRDVNRWFGVWTLQWSYATGGLDPRAYHLLNIAIHLAAGLTLLDLVRRVLLLPGLKPRFGSWAAEIALAVAAIWMVHPLQTQSVTYVVQRYESLMGLCFLLTLFCTLRGATAVRARPWYAAAAAAAWLGAGTKEVMAVCPLVLLLFDGCFLAATWREVFRRRWALHLAIALAAAWLVFAVRGTFVPGGANANAGFGYQGISSWEYLRSQPAVLLHYVRLAFWPDTLVLDYGWRVEHSTWRIYGLGSVIIALVVLSLVALVRWPRPGFLGLAFFLVLAPTSSILPIADIAFEHRMYLPLAAVVTIAVLAVWWLIQRLPVAERQQRLLGGVLLTLVVLALTARTVIRNGDYCHPDRLWAQNILAAPHHGRPYRLLAFHLRKSGRIAEAKAALEQSLAREPNDYKTWVEYGSLFFGERDYERALVHFQKAIAIEPRSAPALGNIGRIEMFRGNYAAALAASRSAVTAEPSDPALRKQVAWLLATAPDAVLRNGDKALRLVESIRQNPHKTDIQWHEVRAAALAELGRFAEAVVAIRRAVVSAESIHSPRVAELKAQQACYQDGRPWRLTPSVPQLAQGQARP